MSFTARSRLLRYTHIAKELESHAAKELAHALKIAKQIDYLAAASRRSRPSRSSFPKSQGLPRFDLNNEIETLSNYRLRIRQAESLGEYALSEVLREDRGGGTGPCHRPGGSARNRCAGNSAKPGRDYAARCCGMQRSACVSRSARGYHDYIKAYIPLDRISEGRVSVGWMPRWGDAGGSVAVYVITVLAHVGEANLTWPSPKPTFWPSDSVIAGIRGFRSGGDASPVRAILGIHIGHDGHGGVDAPMIRPTFPSSP